MRRPVDEADIGFVADNMRPEDVAEVGAIGFSPVDALRLSVNTSDLCMTLVCPKTGLPGALLGAGPSRYPGMGLVWLLGTKAIEQNATTFLRNSKPTVQELFDRTGYDALFNYTHIDNALHHRWLRWLGFKFLRQVTHGPKDDKFYEFVGLRKIPCVE